MRRSNDGKGSFNGGCDVGRQVYQAPQQEGQEGHARMARRDDRLYGPNSSRATKVAVGIVPFQNAEVELLRDWKVDRGDVRGNPEIAREILEFVEENQALSVVLPPPGGHRLRRRMVLGSPVYRGDKSQGEIVLVCDSKTVNCDVRALANRKIGEAERGLARAETCSGHGQDMHLSSRRRSFRLS